MLITVIAGISFYLNEKILANFVKKNTPITKHVNVPVCAQPDVPIVDSTTLVKCTNINGIQTYSYTTTDNVTYEVSTTTQYYSKVCSGFCTEGVAVTGVCKTPNNTQAQQKCLNLIQPDNSGCFAQAKPIVATKDGNNTTYYYAVGPINSLNSCS